MNILLTLKNVSYSVSNQSAFLSKKQEKNILKNISFHIKKNSITGIAGESGSGKTTLIKLIAGLLKPASGEIILSERNRNGQKAAPVQILFQNNSEILNPMRRVDAVVKECIKTNNPSADENLEMEKIFEVLNLSKTLWKRRCSELSGGEQQRVALARLLAVKPVLLLLDEPFSAQDVVSQLNLFNLFKMINKEFNITIICVAHNLKILRKLCNDILILYKGEIVEKNSSQNLFNNPQHYYTKFLLRADEYNLSQEDFDKL